MPIVPFRTPFSCAFISLLAISACGTKADEQVAVSTPSSAEQPDTAMARRFLTLGTAMVELKQEIWARSAGVVVRESQITPQPGAPPWSLPSVQQHPLPPITPADLIQPSASADARALRQRISLSLAGADSSGGRFPAWLQSQGYRVPAFSGGYLPPNQIVFSDSVSLEEVKAIALQLYANRMPVRSIRRFASGGDFRIELRSVSTWADAPPLSPAQIRTLRLPAPGEE
jgi:hypothetical protein